MKISFLCILIYVITLCWCHDEIEFHCATKPGCQIAQCEATARGWNDPGFNIGKHLLSDEFPITCKSKNIAHSQNTGNLLPLVTRNILDIGNVRTDLRKLEENFDKSLNSMKDFGKEIPDIHDLRKENQKQSEKISELEKKNSELSRQMREQQKEITDFKKENSEQAAELVTLKKAMVRFEEKLTAMEKSQQIMTTTRQITKPTTKTRTTLKPSRQTTKPTTKTRTTRKPSPKNCELKIGNICYFAEIPVRNVTWDFNYNKAFEMCQKRNADVGLNRDEESYSAIVNLLRQEMPSELSWISIWTGIKFNPITGDVTPADSFTKWSPGEPYTGSSNKDKTNVYIGVNRDSTDRYQGMVNGGPLWELNGVICEIQT